MAVASRPDQPLTPIAPESGGFRPGPEPVNVPPLSVAAPSVGPASPVESVPAGSEEETLRQIRNLPPELAVLLLSVGVLGFVLPGMIGTPALIAGGLALWPRAFGRAETWFAKRYPSVHRKSLHQMGRFLADLDRRYPQMNDG
jgi:hypothetical protein